MKKIVTVIALDPRASLFYGKQVSELFGERIDVKTYGVKDGSVTNIRQSDLYLISTDAFDSVEEIQQYVPLDAEIMEIQVTFRWDTINTLKQFPRGTKALFVNMTEKMARESITRLDQLGVNQIHFIPFYPGAILGEDIQLAVTPNEERYVPEGIKKVLDIGHRSCTSAMIIEMALRLGFEDLLENDNFKKYFSEVAANTYSFDQMFTKSRSLESQFDILMEILDEGIIGVNEKGEVFACNGKAKEITKVSYHLVIHKRASEVFPNIPFVKCMQDKETQVEKVIRISGTDVNVSVSPVLRHNVCIGAFATLQRFNDAECRQNELRTQLLHKGYRAKYIFEDVAGESDAIKKTVDILRRMAATESPILLIGETGTGKELFAHAVHNASRRIKHPFVAINCAAMPENLLESELFGYEEGAFTGARRGGRSGLFEFAHRGTLFLDEVEGMSPALQVKLLRVLQEKEIMRVGGNRIISIDVRIVAATNEDLEKKVQDGRFRRDLYYRLNTLPALIPPLRERDNDIMLLLERFQIDFGGTFSLNDEVKYILKDYTWPGNIRELRNVVEYFSYTGSQVITVDDLPPTFNYKGSVPKSHFVYEDKDTKSWEELLHGSSHQKSEYLFVLDQLYQASLQNINLGREGILEAARKNKVPLSQQEVRSILSRLDDMEMAKVRRGRGGSRITPKGCAMMKEVYHEID